MAFKQMREPLAIQTFESHHRMQKEGWTIIYSITTRLNDVNMMLNTFWTIGTILHAALPLPQSTP